MKKTIYIIAAALALVACNKVQTVIEDNNDENSSMTEETTTPVENVVTIKATIEGGETKTTYTEDTGTMKAIVGWEAGDKISILYDNGGYKKYEFTTTSGDGSFTGTPGGTEGGDHAYWAIYPYNICTDLYPSSSTPYKESTTITLPTEYTGSGANGIPMLAHTLKSASFDGTYHLKHMGSVIRFKFSNIPSSARKLVISNDSKDLAGRYYTSYDSANDLIYYTSATGDDGEQRSVTYNFTPGGDGKYTFYLPFGCNVTPSGNFTFTFKDSGGDNLCTRTTTLGGLASVSLVRNTMYRVNIDVMTFEGYPGINSLEITPSTLNDTKDKAFTVNSIDFFAYESFKENSTNIKLNANGDGLHGKIYNTTSLGRIIRVVIEKDACTYSYDGSYYTVYAGSSSDPSSTAIPYSSYEYNNYASYSLTSGDYAYFSIVNSTTWNNRIGKITVYYYKP